MATLPRSGGHQHASTVPPAAPLTGPLAALLATVLAALLAVVFLVGSDSPTADAAPGGVSARSRYTDPDEPRMPRNCATPEEQIPPTPMLCRLTPLRRGAPTIVLWGDSHAWMMAPALESAIGHRRVNLVAFLTGGCPITDPHVRSRAKLDALPSCPRTGGLALNYLRSQRAQHRAVRVVVGMSYELYRDNLSDDSRSPIDRTEYLRQNARLTRHATPAAFATLGRLHIPTDVVAQMPMLPEDTPDCRPNADLESCLVPRHVALRSEQANSHYVHRLMSRLTAPHRLILASRFFCSDTLCGGFVHDEPAYYNRLHVGARATRKLGPHFFGTTVKDAIGSAR